jgi:serralysin
MGREIIMVDKVGGAFGERIRGTKADDRLYGLSGNDRLFGLDGNDQLYGSQFPPPDVNVGPQFAIGILANQDYLNGGEGNDKLYGGVGSDRLIGGAGNDILFGGVGGINPEFGIAREDGTPNPAEGEVDRLTGGKGKDTFVLGNRNRVFYASKELKDSDSDDFAIITDFKDGKDRIQLKGGVEYTLQFVTLGSVSGVGIYASLSISQPSELIGIVQGADIDTLNIKNREAGKLSTIV